MDPKLSDRAEALLKHLLEMGEFPGARPVQPPKPGTPSPASPQPLDVSAAMGELTEIAGLIRTTIADPRTEARLEQLATRIWAVIHGLHAHAGRNVLKSPYNPIEQTPFGSDDIVDANHDKPTTESFSDGGVNELPDPSSEVTPQDMPGRKKKIIPGNAKIRRFLKRK